MITNSFKMPCTNPLRWFLLPVLLGAVIAHAEPKAAFEPKAVEVLKAALANGGELSSLHFAGTLNTHMEMKGGKQDIKVDIDFALQKPNMFRFEAKQDGDGSTTVSDGKNVYDYFPRFKRYTVATAPRTMDTVVSVLGGGMNALLAGTLITVLLNEDPYAAAAESLKELTYAGKEKINGVECHKLQFKDANNVAFEVWLKATDKPTLVRLTPNAHQLFSNNPKTFGPAPLPASAKVTMFIDFSVWGINEPLKDELFSFTPPKGAIKAKDIQEIVEDSRKRPPQDGMVGNAAPDFTLTRLNGKTMKLSSHKGKDIVVLDFWATWCPPCVRGMPILAEVTGAYKGKGVVFYAVNQREDKKRVQQFIDKRKLDINVAMDSAGKVGALYNVRGIPQTVIIDKDGTVQAVHVGLSPDLKAKLTAELEDLLAGKKLAR